MTLTFKEVRRLFRVPTSGNVRLSDNDPGWSAHKEEIAELANAQERLYASDTHSILIVLQASDAAGKDGTIKHVMSGVNPQGGRTATTTSTGSSAT